MLSLICTRRALSLCAVGLVFAPAAPAFVINATYDAGITGNAAVKNTLDSVIAFYGSTFTDNISIDINFETITTSGILGHSSASNGVTSYGAIHNALIADVKSDDDVAAMAQIAASPYSEGNMVATKANFRALGLSVGNFGSPDGTVGLNTAACFYGHANPVANKFDLYSVACHEIDEVLGTGSGIGGNTAAVADIYRYTDTGARTFSTSTAIHTGFSIDGSHQIVEYNQFGRTVGDWGDWKLNSPAQVQDFQGTPGVVINPNNELRLLDVIGYDRAAPVPEPASVLTLGVGIVAVLVRRRGRRAACVATVSK